MANGLLVAMAALFVLARHQVQGHPAWGYVAAFAEAALVGALADWFAVTALFRHPLGLPIPHTAIVPAKKDRIAASMAEFLRAHFLVPHVLARRLHRFDAAGLVAQWLAQGAAADAAPGAGALLADLVAALDPETMGAPARGMLIRALASVEPAPLLGEVLRAALADGRHRGMVDALLRRAGTLLEANEPALRALIHERASTLLRWTRLDERMANALLDALYALLAECVIDPQHPLRQRIDAALASLADQLIADPAMHARVNRLKAEALANPAFAAWLDRLWQRSRAGLIAALAPRDDQAEPPFAAFGRALADDARLRAQINRVARRALAGTAHRHGDAIVRVVSDTVQRWDARTVTQRIERAVGRDLQFIRINGTLVGGLVGLALHFVERFV